MRIKGMATIEEFKQERDRRIQKWIDNNFVKGSVSWKMDGATHIIITDKTGDSMRMEIDYIE